MRSLKHRARLLTIVLVTCLLAMCLAMVSTGAVFGSYSQRVVEAIGLGVTPPDNKPDAIAFDPPKTASLAMMPVTRIATTTQASCSPDTTPPVLMGVPENTAFQCFNNVPAPATVTATDNCDSTVPVTFTEMQSNPGSNCNNTITRTWRAMDAAGNSATSTQTITVFDTIPPVLAGVPTSGTFQCLADVPTATVTATDNCDGSLPVTFTEMQSNPGTSCNNVITRTWRAVDSCNNSVTATRTFTVNDTIPPVLVGIPNDATFQCLADVPAPPTVTATDNCGLVPVTFTETRMGSCPTIIRRTWRAEDSCQNSSTATRTITVRDTIPPVLAGVPGNITVQCPSDIPTVTATDNCDGTLPVTFTDVQNNNTITRTWKAMDSCGNSAAATRMITINLSDGNCLSKGPGEFYPPASGVSDQKPGSVLIYNFYASSASNPVLENTRINLTNLSTEESVAVHLFFVDGSTCAVADNYICLTKSQTMTFLMSDIDPGVSGYIVAVATDKETGQPIAFNCLIGDAYIKLASGHAANLGAEAIAAQKDNPASLNAAAMTATLNFDNVSYNALPRVLAMSSLASPADVNSTLLVVNRIGGDLRTLAASAGAMFGVVYDQLENPYSFTFSGGCQLRTPLTSTGFPRTTPRLGSIIPAGAAGWMKFWATADVPLLGAMINFNPASATNANAFNQGHNLHKLTFTTTGSVTIPVFASNCQ